MVLVLRFAARYLLPHWWWFLLGVLALIGTNAIAVTIPLYLKEAIDAFSLGAEGVSTVLWDAGMIAVLGVLVIVIRTLSRVLFFTPGRIVEAEVKRDLFERVMRHQPSFLRGFPSGDLVSRASSDVNNLRLLAGFGLLQAFNVTAVLILTLTQMMRLAPWLTLWMLVPLVLGLLLTQGSIYWLFILVRRMQQEIAAISDHALSSYEGVATLKAFVAEDPFEKRFDALNRAYTRTTVQRAGLRALIGPIMNVATMTSVFLLLWIGGDMVIQETISVGDLVALISLVAILAGPLRGLSFLLSIVKQAQASLERIFAVTDPVPERPDLPDPMSAPAQPPALSIRGLTFRYPDAETPSLVDVSVEVPAGATLGVLGPTGAGKTTLLRCLSRLYNPPPGTVFVDGVDVRKLDLDDWRRRAVLVPQRAFLFSETLRDNILLGEDDPQRLQQALELAALGQDVEALPSGVESQVGEAGLMLSGGQRQRSALARGLIREPAVLMLDDVLSAVDHATEAELIESLRPGHTLAPTTVIVANRISAIQHAEVILVLDRGRVVDQGTHAELAEREGLYRDTWEKQREGDGRE